MTSSIVHRRRQDLLLISRLFNIRHHVSPFTLILDSLEQSGKALLSKVIDGAKSGKVKGRVLFLSFETIKKGKNVDVFIKSGRQAPDGLLKGISGQRSPGEDTLIVIDSLNGLARLVEDSFGAFLSALAGSRTSIVGVYHVDVPLSTSWRSPSTPYAPHPLTLLKYLSTSIFVVHSLPQQIARKRARDRSLAEPTFGLAEPDEGTVAGLGANDDTGVVVELESRRKSGRSVTGWFVMRYDLNCSTIKELEPDMTSDGFIRLQDYPPYRASEMACASIAHDRQDELVETTFNLGLSSKQRTDRDNVVLPYFDAQRAEGGAAEGGRILYEMGVEDDFDDEEDEI